MGKLIVFGIVLLVSIYITPYAMVGYAIGTVFEMAREIEEKKNG